MTRYTFTSTPAGSGRALFLAGDLEGQARAPDDPNKVVELRQAGSRRELPSGSCVGEYPDPNDASSSIGRNGLERS